MRVLAIGECMAELAPGEAENAYTLGFAGDTFNTAWYLAKLMPTAEVSYLTALGTDPLSQDLLGLMGQSGIQTTHVAQHPTKTIGLYMIALRDGERSFSYWRGESAARTLADNPEDLANAMSQADLIFFSGITLAILDDGARHRLLSAAATARAAGKQIAFDPNLRPRLWASPEEMTETVMLAAQTSDIVLPSYEDEADWFGDANPDATMRRYLDAGATCVVVKNGADPVLYQNDATQGETAVAAVAKVVDTTAAGDSFNAGVLAGLYTTDNIADGVLLGCRLARWVVSNKGALVPMESFATSQ